MRLLAAALAVLLAGCLGPASLLQPSSEAPPALDAGWALRAIPSHTGHDHANHSHHVGLSTPNMELLAWDPLLTNTMQGTAGGYYCGDAATGPAGRRMAYVASYSSDVAFVGVDLTDPLAPRVLTEFALPNGHVYDLTATPDGNWVALGLNLNTEAVPSRRNLTAPTLPALPLRGGAPCGNAEGQAAASATTDPTPYPGGVLLVDVSDPANPRTADYFPQPGLGVHSIVAAQLDGRTILLASNVNYVQQFSYYTFLEVVDGGLRHLATYRPPVTPDPVRTPYSNLHNDGALQVHPVTGQPLAYLADWRGGVLIVDVSDFNNLRVIGHWSAYNLGRTDDAYSVHQADPLPVLWDGRHYTIVGPELVRRPANTPSGVQNILDTTDPANPFWVSGWTLPVEVAWGTEQLTFSTHYPAFVDRMMYVPMYHGGVWAVDLSDVTAPRTAGVFVPDQTSPAPPKWSAQTRMEATPTVLQVLPLSDGSLVAFDSHSGAYVFRMNLEVRLPPVPEWPVFNPTTQ